MDSLAASSSSSVTVRISKLLSDEKEDVRHWLRAEMQSLVDPLVESLFDKLTAKLTTALGQKNSGDDQPQASMISTAHFSPFNAQMHLPANVQPSMPTSSSFMDGIICNSQFSSHLSQLQKHGNIDYSLQPEGLINARNRLSYFEAQPIKEEILDEPIPALQVHCSLKSVSEQACHSIESSSDEISGHQLINQSSLDKEDFWEDDCDCDDCANGKVGIKEEHESNDDNNGLKWIDVDEDDNEESSRPMKKARMDTTHNYGRISSQGLTNPNQTDNNLFESQANINVDTSEQMTTLQLKCLLDCSLMFDTRDKLDHHMWQRHFIRANRCVVKECGESFDNRHNLGQHIKQKHKHITEWHCGKCVKHYKTYRHLSTHNKQQHHLGQYQCSFPNCGFIGEFMDKVYRHYKQQHKPKLMCQQPGCRHLARDVINLKIHERVHLGIKPYLCKWPDCGYSAAQRNNTIAHIQTAHLNPLKALQDVTCLGDPKNYVEVVHELL